MKPEIQKIDKFVTMANNGSTSSENDEAHQPNRGRVPSSTFSFVKMMKCFNCHKTFPITEEGFPEDLYDLILHYKMDQLFWVCKFCKGSLDLTNSVSLLSDGQEKIFSGLVKLQHQIDNLTEEVRSDYRQYDQHFPVRSMAPRSAMEINDLRSFYEHLRDQDGVRYMHPYPLIGSHRRLQSPFLLNLNDSSFCDFDASRNRKQRSRSPPGRSRAEENFSFDDSGSDSDSLRKRQKGSQSPPPASPKEGLSHIHSILNSIKISKEDEKDSKEIITAVLEALLNSLKKDPDFDCLYNKLYYTGSVYNGLRITSASEFDIDLVLKMPSGIILKPEFFSETRSFGKLKVDGINTGLGKSFQICFSEGYLDPKKVLSWLQGLVDVVLKSTDIKIPNVKHVKNIQSGPARTLVIETELQSSLNISIDLVPVFEFDHTFLLDTPILPELQKITDNIDKYKWFMVPKPCKEEVNLPVLDAKYSWRLDFPDAEKDLLHAKECAKPIIKILKLLRDKQKWKKIASYYLKTVVMLKMRDEPSKLWSGSYLFDRFLEVLQDLKSHLDKQFLPHIVTRQNLFHNFTVDQCKGWSNYLQKMIAAVKLDAKSLENYFKLCVAS